MMYNEVSIDNGAEEEDIKNNADLPKSTVCRTHCQQLVARRHIIIRTRPK